MKKLLLTTATVLIAICAIFAVSLTTSALTYGDLTYSVDSNGHIIITDCAQTATEVVIPSAIDGHPVTRIGEYAFSWRSLLTSITIPDSVTSIGDYAFNFCSWLKSITIPASVTSIGNSAFYYCKPESIAVDANNQNYSSDEYGVLFNKDKTRLIKASNRLSGNYAVPNTVTKIDNNAFFSCKSLTSVTVPASVTEIACGAFYYCNSLKSITVDINNPRYSNDENGLLFSKDREHLLYVPEGLTCIKILASVKYIENDFVTCDALESIIVDENNPYYSNDVHGVLFNKNKTELIEAPNAKKGSYKIPNGVKVIGNYAFLECKSITNVTIPISVTTIGHQSFDYCEKLTDIYYEGNESQWNSISIGNHYSNEWKNVTIHYGSAAPEKPGNIPGNTGDTGDISDNIPGDISGDGVLDIDDAVLLFRHSMLPEIYPITYSGSLDFNSDGKVDIDDAVLLFRHSMLPDIYPIG